VFGLVAKWMVLYLRDCIAEKVIGKRGGVE